MTPRDGGRTVAPRQCGISAHLRCHQLAETSGARRALRVLAKMRTPVSPTGPARWRLPVRRA
jgi:hypothetical protein